MPLRVKEEVDDDRDEMAAGFEDETDDEDREEEEDVASARMIESIARRLASLVSGDDGMETIWRCIEMRSRASFNVATRLCASSIVSGRNARIWFSN